MYGMSEGSLHPIGALRLRSFPSAFKRTLGRLAGRRRRQEKEAAPGPGSSSLAATAIREYAEAQATLFERAERLAEKAERLAGFGIPRGGGKKRPGRATRG